MNEGNIDPTYFARWNIQEGKYFADVGKYLEAIEAFQTTIETTDEPHLKAEAHLQRASVLSVFLDKHDEAAKEYETILKEFPQDSLADTALYRLGFLYYSQSKFKEALPYLELYLKNYPGGKFRGTVQFLLQETKENLGLVTVRPSQQQPKEQRQQKLKRPLQPLQSAPFELPKLSVRVKILENTNNVTIISHGAISLYNSAGSSLYQAAGRVNFQVVSGVLYADGKSLGVRDVTAKANSPLGATKSDKLYRGDMKILINNNGMELINHVNIEEYLYGVVPSESPSSWPIEALKAQAIAARTYVLYQMAYSKERKYDLVDDERNQVYGGIKAERDATTKVVNATMGQVLVYEGRPIYAMFTANSGWHTADPQDIFGEGLAYLKAFPDEHSRREQYGEWTVKKTAREIEKGIEKIGLNMPGITDIKPHTVDKSGRVVKVYITYEGGTKTFRTRTTLMRAAGLGEILFGIEKDGNQYIFKGGGFGHGVGLSQWGAKDMAETGSKAEDILSFYYRGARLKKMW
ncbi:MAG: SpoIID/LytB domain-containing protein [Deltaproteobacteria bacterium]|nr:SpoIID/LytB domain-containing protein [Deltaproteobacteria bacterium]